MYSTVIVIQCLFLFQATMADSAMDLLKLSVSNQVLVLNSQIKDLKTLVEHQKTEENAKLAKLETKIGNLESEIARLTHSQVTTTKSLPTTTSSTATTTTTKTTTPSTTTPLGVNTKDQAILLHIKDQDIKIEHQNTQIAELKVLVEHQNTKFANENAKFAAENAKFAEDNAKFSEVKTLIAEQNTKIYKLESEIKMLTNSQAATTSSPQTTSSPTTTSPPASTSSPTTSSSQTTSSPTTASTSSTKSDTSSGVVFTRWGRRDCPAGISTPVYNGTVGGSKWDDTGAAVNHLCMPNQPTWDGNKLFKPSYSGYVFSGAYYSLPDSSLDYHVAPCAVCRAELFSTKVMIPGRDTCFPGWTQAYSGELVSGPYDYKAATEYTCLDKQPQKAGSGGSIGLYLVSVLARCGFAYQYEALLTCVVCLK